MGKQLFSDFIDEKAERLLTESELENKAMLKNSASNAGKIDFVHR